MRAKQLDLHTPRMQAAEDLLNFLKFQYTV